MKRAQTRTFLNLFRKTPPEKDVKKPKAPEPILSQDNLFHPFSKSPFQAVKDRVETIKKLAPCPVCLKENLHEHGHAHASEPEGATKMARKHVAFECPDCGWPTHCSEKHWKADEEHQRYCGRLREANEDEHDLRSGRRMTEFEMPGTANYLQTTSLEDHLTLCFAKIRPYGIRCDCIILKLGHILVHAWVSLDGYRAHAATCQQAPHIPYDDCFCPTSEQWSYSQQPTGYPGRYEVTGR